MKMKPILTLLSGCLLAATTLLGQDTSFKKNAIFLTYGEFKNNMPSVDTLKLHLVFQRNNRNKVQYETSKGKLADYKRSIWGFSDTADMYIWHRGCFNLALTTGKYYVFSNIEVAHKNVPGPYSSGFSSAGVMPGVRSYKRIEIDIRKFSVMDYNTGRIEDLSEKKIKEILGQDQKLLDEYQEDTQQDELIVEYIRRFNERNPLKNN